MENNIFEPRTNFLCSGVGIERTWFGRRGQDSCLNTMLIDDLPMFPYGPHMTQSGPRLATGVAVALGRLISYFVFVRQLAISLRSPEHF